MTLRTRFTAAVFLLVLVVLASALVNLRVSQRRYLTAQMESTTRESTRRLASVCEEALASQSDLIALNYFKVWLEAPGAARVALVRTDGTVYLASDLVRGEHGAIGRPLARELPGKRLFEASAPVTLYGKPFGKVIAFYDLDVLETRTHEAMEDMQGRMLVPVLLTLAAGMALALWLGISLNRPVEELVQGARRIGSGDFAAEIPSHRKDELGLIAREFNQMARRLRELDQLKDRFLHSVSHEMRAPLSVMTSAVYHARRVTENGTKDGLADDLAQIDRGLLRLSGFVDNILDLARLQAQRITFSFQSVQPAKTLEELRGLFARRAEEFGIRFEVAAEPGTPAVRADPARLQQVLSNLVINAFKYTPDGGSVRVRAATASDGVEFSVTDSGPGLPAASMVHLFSRFGVSDPAPNPRKLPSTGLGLSICKEIVDAHKGRIWAESEPGKGATFRFVLPRAA